MTSSRYHTDEVINILQGAGIFEFSVEARLEIDAFFGGVERGASDLVVQQARALSHLHAAEFALQPAFEEPGSLRFPTPSAIVVTPAHARLALLKGDCSLIIWTHAASNEGIGQLRSSDLTVFSGDASKLERLRPMWAEEVRETSNIWSDYGRMLEAVHRDSQWDAASKVADSGVLRLQIVLWRLKVAVTAEAIQDSNQSLFATAFEELES
jgi:hypothetical protein